jgi:alpha-tubulin suppressor-like RCC1 family protein
MRYLPIVLVLALTSCADGREGLATGPAPANLSPGAGWQAISVGYLHACGVLAGGSAYCWGSRAEGQLGAGEVDDPSCTTTPSGLPVCTTPVPVAGDLAFDAISAGFDHTCGLAADGVAFCWGRGDEGQLGTFATGERCELDGPSRICSRRPVAAAGGRSWAAVVAGYEYTCALDAGGEAWCWGGNAAGQLGATTVATCQARGSEYPVACSVDPVRVATTRRFVSLALGSYHACGLTSGGEAWCWGHNLAGQLGTGERGEGGPIPVPVAAGHRFVSLAAGYDHTCGVTMDGRSYCWGGEGPNRLDVRTVPAPVAGAPAFTTLSRSRDHTCALDATGNAYCWGFNASGQLGNGQAAVCTLLSCSVPFEPVPVAVLGGTRFVTVAAGYESTCALTAGGEAWCWGLNYAGQLGDGSRESRAVPAPLAQPR